MYSGGEKMRTAIWEYLIPSFEDKEILWNKCVFVFDTNVLLNLYRYTSNTRDTLLSALDDLKERVWLPYQVAYEYAKNRFDVIYETVEKYKKLEKLQQDFIDQYIKELRLKPSDESIEQLQDLIGTWITEQKEKNVLVTQASDDKILGKVLSIFDGKVGTPFSQEELDAIYAEGKERYESQIPPGFCDSKKEKDGYANNAYGDLIVWKQIINFSTHGHKDIIYVTHDQKKIGGLFLKVGLLVPVLSFEKSFLKKPNRSFICIQWKLFWNSILSIRGKLLTKASLMKSHTLKKSKNEKVEKKPLIFLSIQWPLKEILLFFKIESHGGNVQLIICKCSIEINQ